MKSDRSVLIALAVFAAATVMAEKQKSLVDYFLPMEPQGKLVSEDIWGDPNVLPRDIKNGLEDPTLENWCYWDGRIVKDDEGKYHIYACRWHHSFPHSRGWKEDSKGIHAISDNIMGPYEDKGLVYPQWQGGKGSNVIGLRMHDGRYAVVTSEITQGEVFVSDSPEGPFELLGEIKWDANGFHPGLAAYKGGKGHMSNVKILLRPDGKYMIVPRSTCVMISEDGILGPYKIMSDRVYKNYPELPQEKNEDPTVWYSGGMYHIVYNHWPSKTSYHFTSIDGIHDWTYRGIAFRKGESKIFRYTDGTVNDWEFIERATAYVDENTGHVTHFIFSVLDVHKGRDGGNDNHASKIVVVPFDGEAFDRDMQARVSREKATRGHHQRRRPNLLFIVTDEHNFRTLGCYRNLLSKEQAEIWGPGNVVDTPHIDSLAERGTLFNRMYASAPVCTPARASMFTGQYGHQLGMPNNSSKPGDGKYLRADVPTIAQILRDAGYMTGYCGKWHLAEQRGAKHDEFWQPHPVGKPGFDYGFTDNRYMNNSDHGKFRGIDAAGKPYYASRRSTRIGTDDAGQPVYRDERSENVKYTTDWLTDRALEFIETYKDKPFYYVVSIPDPHTPDVAREPYYSMYKDMNFEKPRTCDVARPEGTPSWQGPDGKVEKQFQNAAHYFGMVKCIDDNVGRLLAKLENEGILEDTIVVFAADHGDLYGEHARMNKGTVHEASAKVPFVMAHGKNRQDPLIPRGKVVPQAANTTDWMPTFLSLLKAPCPEVPGRDLTPLLAAEPPADWHDVTFSTLWFVAAIDAQHKLVLMAKNQPWLLDNEADPDELVNFYEDPAYAPTVRRLARDMQKFMTGCDLSNKWVSAQLEDILKPQRQ